jgi:Tol biopolymer transport system component/uncharacterized protein YjdB
MPSFPFLRLRSARRRSGGVVKSPGLAPFSLLAVLVVWACSDNAFTNVVDPRLTPKSIALSSSSVTFAALQESRQLNATVLNTGGDPIADATVSWTTSNAAVATVSSSGSVVAIANGTAQLTASSGTLQAQVSVTVAQVPVSGGLVPDSVMFTAAGDTVRLAVSGEDANGFAVQGGTWVWSVTDSSVATVSSEGLVTALESGVTTVRAGLQAFSATAVIEVDQRAASLTLSDDSVAFSAVGATRQLAATVMDSGGAAVSSPEISWSSSDAEIATVSDGGVVRSTGNGTATIFASLDGLAAAVTVTVAQVPASLMIAEDSVAFSSLEVTKGLEATVVDSLGSTMSLSLVTWSTSDTAVAAVSGSGEVTSKGDGSAVIYVESGGLVDSVLVSVVQIPVAAVMSVDSARIREIGKQVTLSAKVVDANDQPYIGGSEIVWSSTDEAVAPVRENADGEGEVTAIARGFAWIGVEVLGMDLSGSASIEVYLEGRVAFTQRDALTDEYALYVMDDDGRYVTQLTEMGAYNPRDPQWVSDGETVVFESGGALYSVDDGDGLFEESFAVTLAAQRSAGTYREVSWSSDGTRIAFTGDDGGIYVANADGSSEQQLVDPAVNGASGWPSWSPDGQFISFTSYRDGQGQLYVMESDGTGQMPLLPFVLRNRTNTDYDAVWSPANNGQVAFVSDREGDLNVYVYQPETATEVAMLTRLTPGNGDDRDPSWSPDGRALVYSSYSGSDDGRSAEVYRVAVDGAASERLTTNTNSDFEPVWGGGTWTSLSLVENAVAATITLSREEVMLASLNETQQLSGVVRNALGGLIAGSTLTWTSSDASVATVSATGLVTAIDNGTATITASTQGVSSTASVTVDQVAATVVLSPTAETFVSLTDTTQFSATVRDALGSTITGASVAWSSSDAAVATASSDGLVTAESNGSAVLSATSGSATGFAAITVGQVAATVVLSPTAETFVSLTDTTQFSATVQDALGVTMAGAAVTWASSATGVASVDAGGLVTSVADGSATLSATSGAASADAAITVGQVGARVVVSVDSARVRAIGEDIRISGQLVDALDVPVGGVHTYTWASTDPGVAVTSSAVTSDTVVVTGVAQGFTTIFGSTAGVDGSASIEVYLGGRIVVARRQGFSAEHRIFVMDEDGRYERQITDANGGASIDRYPGWRNEGRSITFVRDGDMYQASDMYEWMPDTLPTATLLATSPGGHGYRDAAWTLDGTQVVYTGSDQGIYKADFDGTNETQLVDPLADGLSGWPSWAPDASTIAFTSYRDGHAQIYEMNADGTGQGHILPLGLRALTVDTRAVYSPRNSNQIAFVSDRGIYDFAQGNLNVYIYDRGANLLAVPPVESDISATVLNPDSEGNFFLATAAPQDDRDVFWSFASYAPLTGSGGNRIVVVRYDTGSDDLSAELYSQCVTKGLICPEGRLTFNSVSDVEPAWSRRPLIDP